MKTYNLIQNIKKLTRGFICYSCFLILGTGLAKSGEGLNKLDFNASPVPIAQQEKSSRTNKPVVYILDPVEWEIVEGKVSDIVALKNRLQLEAAFRDAVTKQADTFKINKLDAYFNVVAVTQGRNRFESWREAITLPANFNLKMSSETHIRTQPNNNSRYALLSNATHDSISITGGNLYGERNDHIYSGSGSDEWGHVLDLIGLENGLIDGVTINDGNGDGMTIHELEFTYKPNHDKSRNIKITNCTFDNNRRNNLAITGGMDILVEGNTFLNAGRDTPTSKGTSPKAAIDIEPYKERDKKTNELIHYEKAEDIVIRNNVEKNSAWQGFTVATGRAVLIENNTLESSINLGFADHVVIRNNSMIHPGTGGVGMTLGAEGDRVFKNEIYNNVVKNFKQAISIKGNGFEVYKNEFSNFSTGLRIYDLLNSRIYDNSFKSSLEKSHGIFIHVTTIENSEITGNLFESDQSALHIFNLNFYGKKEAKVTFIENTFTSNKPATLGNSNGVILKKNLFKTAVQIRGTSGILMEQNEIISGSQNGVSIKKENSNLELRGNKIRSTAACIQVQGNPVNYVENDNICLN